MNNTMQNDRPKRPDRQIGGEPAAATGDRDAARFDIDSAPNADPQVDRGWLTAFEAELNRVVAAGELDVAF